MRSKEAEQQLIAQIKEMQALGFSKTRESLLPQIYVAVYGKMFRKDCGACIRDAYDALGRWANKKLSNNNNYSMSSYKFKREYHDKTITFFKGGGAKVRVTKDNLTDEYAEMILAIPKYAHVLEPLPASENKAADIPKAEIPAEPVIMDVTNILADDNGAKVPNELPSVASTLTGQAIDGPKQKGKPGPKPKVK